MLRAAALFTALCLAAAPVAAEPAARKPDRAKDAKKPAAKAPATPAPPPAAKTPATSAPPPAARPAPDLSRAATTAARRAGVAAPAPAPRPAALDLTPSRVIEDVARSGRMGSERSPGLSLGDDGDWKVQAAQVGIMAAGFAALTALCSGGSCLVPDAATDWIPGMDRDVAAPPVEVRDIEPLRSAR